MHLHFNVAVGGKLMFATHWSLRLVRTHRGFSLHRSRHRTKPKPVYDDHNCQPSAALPRLYVRFSLELDSVTSCVRGMASAPGPDFTR